MSTEPNDASWIMAEGQLTRALLDVLTRQLGPVFAGAVREELLARADGLERRGGASRIDVARASRQIGAEPMWDDLTGRRPSWTRFDVNGKEKGEA